jgi:GNAT superfamily N-acetyltransferase
MIRQPQMNELEALTRLALLSKAVWGYSEQFMAACREELTLAEDELEDLFLKEVDGEVVGFYSLQRVSATHVELGYLYVAPIHLRRGHGKELMADALRRAKALAYRTLIIQADPHAVDFYVAAGAKQVGVRESGSIPGRMLPLFEVDLTDHT